MSRPITVITVTYNAAHDVGAMLESLQAPNGLLPAVVAVDNGSRDGTVPLLRAIPDVAVIEQSNTGYAHGINRALARTDRDHDVLVLNPDIVLADGAIARLARVLDDDPSAGIVVPAIEDAGGRLQPSLRREPSVLRTLAEAILGGGRAGRFGERITPDLTAGRQPADWATGAAMLIRAEARQQLGLWDTSFFLYSEETEYCLRARDAGYRVVCEPEAVARHVGGELATNPQLWALRAVNRVRLHRRRHGVLAAGALRAASILFEVRRVMLGDRVSRPALRALLRPDLDLAAVDLTVALGGDPVPMGKA